MSRYIDADKAKEKLGVVRGAYNCFLEEDRPYYDVLSETIKMINEMPTADLVEVVRCKDCKHRPKKVGNEGNGFDYEFSEEYACPGYCEDGYYAELFDDSFYCAWGER